MRSAHSPRAVRLWLQTLVLSGIAGVVMFAVHALRGQQRRQDLPQRYAAFAAWSYRENLKAELRVSIEEFLSPVRRGAGPHAYARVPTAQALGKLLPWNDRCSCRMPRSGPTPSHTYAFVLGSDSLDVGVDSGAERGWQAGAPPVDARRLSRLFTNAARSGLWGSWGYRVFLISGGDSSRMLALTAMLTHSGDTLIYGLEYSALAVDSMLGRALTHVRVLPASVARGRAAASVMDFEVTDATGRLLFRSRPLGGSNNAATVRLPAPFGAMQVSARMRPEAEAEIRLAVRSQPGAPSVLVAVAAAVLLALDLGLRCGHAILSRQRIQVEADRSAFLHGVSHELRRPLEQMRRSLGCLRLGRDADARARRSGIDAAYRRIQHIERVVDGLLRSRRPSP